MPPFIYPASSINKPLPQILCMQLLHPGHFSVSDLFGSLHLSFKQQWPNEPVLSWDGISDTVFITNSVYSDGGAGASTTDASVTDLAVSTPVAVVDDDDDDTSCSGLFDGSITDLSCPSSSSLYSFLFLLPWHTPHILQVDEQEIFPCVLTSSLACCSHCLSCGCCSHCTAVVMELPALLLSLLPVPWLLPNLPQSEVCLADLVLNSSNAV